MNDGQWWKIDPRCNHPPFDKGRARSILCPVLPSQEVERLVVFGRHYFPYEVPSYVVSALYEAGFTEMQWYKYAFIRQGRFIKIEDLKQFIRERAGGKLSEWMVQQIADNTNGRCLVTDHYITPEETRQLSEWGMRFVRL